MKRASVVGTWALCAALASACGGRGESEQAEVAGQEDARPQLVTATGCVTSDGDRFVLTALQPGAAGPTAAEQRDQPLDPAAASQPTTSSYELVGEEGELRALVGRHVRVTGEAAPPQVAEMREMTPRMPAAGTSGQEGAARPQQGETPKVGTATETRLEVTRLTVRSTVETGEPCPAAPARQGQPPR